MVSFTVRMTFAPEDREEIAEILRALTLASRFYLITNRNDAVAAIVVVVAIVVSSKPTTDKSTSNSVADSRQGNPAPYPPRRGHDSEQGANDPPIRSAVPQHHSLVRLPFGWRRSA